MTGSVNEKSNPVLEILEKSGNYHWVQGTLICISSCVVVWANLNFVFIAGDVNYRCKVQECESPDQPFTPDWWPSDKIDHCYRPVLNFTSLRSSNTCTNRSFTQNVEKCSEWVYETNDTIVAELNLACQLWKQTMVGTVHAIGMILPVLVMGWIADRFGRKWTLIVCSVGYVVGYFKLLAPTYTIYLVIEFLEAAFSGGVLGSAAVLIIEITPKNYRAFAGVIFECAFNMGEFTYACLGMVAKNWRTLAIIVYSPCILMVSYILLLKESPRWQILQGKTIDAKKTLNLMAKMNNMNVNIEEIDNLDINVMKQQLNLEKEVKKEGLKEVFCSIEMMKRLAMGFVTRFTAAFVYYGLMLNSVYLPGDKYTNFMYGALCTYPAEFFALYIMSKFGRKFPLIYGFTVCGIVTVAVEFITDDYKWLKIVMYLFAKMAMCACFTGVVTYTLEVYPTSVRGSMIGMCMLASNIGSMVAPQIPTLAAISPVLPSICYGCSTLLSTCLLFFTPETNNLPLPDTIKQIEDNNSKIKNIENPVIRLG